MGQRRRSSAAVLELRFSRSGQFHRHLDSGHMPDERLRISGRHLRLVMRTKAWDELSDQERNQRLHERL
jgi:hypothetical protein